MDPRAAALQIEAKKHALRQQQDGCWILTMKVHQNDMPSEIMKAPMGARYVVALVEIGDDEQPINRGGGEASSGALEDPKQHGFDKAQPRSSAAQKAGADKTKRRFDEMTPVQQAGMLCSEQAFHVFLRERHASTWNDCNGLGTIFNVDIAAAVVRELCKVDSRADIKPDNTEWSSLVLAYRLWQREPEFVG